MRDMGVRHKQVVIAYLGKAAILLRAPVHGGVLAYRVSIADFQLGYLRRILFVLGIFADGSELIDAILLAYGGRPLNNNVGAYHRTGADFYTRAYDRKRAYRHVIGQLRLAINYRCWIDQINLPRLRIEFQRSRRTRHPLLRGIQMPKYYACF